MRKTFAEELYKQMSENRNIVVLLGDLGFGMFDKIRKDYKSRVFNCGASEQAMMGMAVGMSYEGKIPMVYSITNFLLYRPFETIRNYIDHEKANVKLIGSGRDNDYAHDGYSHQCKDAKQVLECFPSIQQFWPETKEEIPTITNTIFKTNEPCFVSLKR